MTEAFMFDVGGVYTTQAGNEITVLDRTKSVGYECLVCSDGIHRYDRSNKPHDAGRVTGTDFDYSCPDNIKRPHNRPFVPLRTSL